MLVVAGDFVLILAPFLFSTSRTYLGAARHDCCELPAVAILSARRTVHMASAALSPVFAHVGALLFRIPHLAGVAGCFQTIMPSSLKPSS
jgi:hypothetical protein